MDILSAPTYLEASEKRFEKFKEDIASLSASAGVRHETGTSIVGFLSPDEKIGVIASDGRVSSIPFIWTENFRKIFPCRIGFLGISGELASLQKGIEVYVNDLDAMCDARKMLMTPSGAAHRLRDYVMQMARAGLPNSFLCLFWDAQESHCRLYAVEAGCHLRQHKWASIGSGSGEMGPLLRKDVDDAPFPATVEGLKEKARALLRRVNKIDAGTGPRIFFGIIENGQFNAEEE